jgi:hypothetical protein
MPRRVGSASGAKAGRFPAHLDRPIGVYSNAWKSSPIGPHWYAAATSCSADANATATCRPRRSGWRCVPGPSSGPNVARRTRPSVRSSKRTACSLRTRRRASASRGDIRPRARSSATSGRREPRSSTWSTSRRSRGCSSLRARRADAHPRAGRPSRPPNCHGLGLARPARQEGSEGGINRAFTREAAP